jgi:hypothetical protein
MLLLTEDGGESLGAQGGIRLSQALQDPVYGLGAEVGEAAEAGSIGREGAGIVAHARGKKDHVSLRHGGIHPVGEEQPLPLLADPHLVSVVVMQVGEVLRIGEGAGAGV